MTKLSVFIVEDERIVAETLAAMVEDLGHEVVGIAHTMSSAREGLRTNDFDLAILDINLKIGTEGIQLGKELLVRGLPFFFVTSYSDMKTLEAAKEVRPGAYVVKPFTETDLFVAIEMTTMRNQGGSGRGVTVRKGNAHSRVPLNEVRFFKTENIYVEVHTSDKVWLKRISLTELLEKIDDDRFVQTHRSYAVNADFVTGYSNQEVFLGADAIPISKSRREAVKSIVGNI